MGHSGVQRHLPYDEFTKSQIAGDLYHQPTVDQQIASGFNRLHLIIDVGTALPDESFMRNVVDRVSAVGTTFLGLTLECAVCHDHKYDPITQKDFYQFYAFFNNFDGTPETGRRSTTDFKRGLQTPYIEFPTPQQSRLREELKAKADSRSGAVAALRDELEKLKERKEVAQSEVEDVAASIKAKQAELEVAVKASNSAKQELEVLLLQIPATLVMKERNEVRPAHIMVRGNYDQPGDLVARDTPGFLPPLSSDKEQRDRMDLANWLVDPGTR